MAGISLNRHTIIRVLSAITCFLLFASIAGQVLKYGFGHNSAYGLIRLFNVNEEGNIPTFFSAMLLLLASLLLALITVLKTASAGAYSRHWTVLSLILLYMAVDESAGVHEMFIKPTQWLLGEQRPSGIFHYRWIISGIAIVVVVVLSYLKFFLHLPRQTQRHFFAAAAIFLGGALGIEMVESYYTGLHAMGKFQLSMLATIEEGLEMAGVIVFINALLTYVAHHHEDILLRFGEQTEHLVSAIAVSRSVEPTRELTSRLNSGVGVPSTPR
jgi:hypothetical protein